MPQRVGNSLDLTLVGVVANDATLSVPAGYRIRDIFMRNTTANAVTGGVRIGTTDGGTQVVTGLAVGANAFVRTTGVQALFSATAAQTLYIQAVTAWNSASLDFVITLDRGIP